MIRYAIQRLFKKVLPTGWSQLDAQLQGGIRPGSVIFVNLPRTDNQLINLLFGQIPHVQYRIIKETADTIPDIKMAIDKKPSKTIYVIYYWSKGHIYQLPKDWTRLIFLCDYVFDFGVQNKLYWRYKHKKWNNLLYYINDSHLKFFQGTLKSI